MVRVLLCHYFKSQRIFSESYQPTSLCSTREFLFVGIGGCRILVYSLEQPNFPQLYQFSTISTAFKVICNDNSNYIATIERKHQRDATRFARVYFNWDSAIVNEAVKVVIAGHSLLQRNRDYNQQFLAIELCSKGSVNAISSCKASGNIIISTDGKLCLYRQCIGRKKTPEVKSSEHGGAKICDFEHFLDIEPGFVVRGIDFCGPFVSFRSKLEVRVIKLVFSTQNLLEKKQKVGNNGEKLTTPSSCDAIESLIENSKEVVDENCILWTFGTSPVSYKETTSQMSSECRFKTVRSESTYTDTFVDPKEVTGPLADVKGHPLKVVLSGRFGIGIAIGRDSLTVQAVTMLYRRFKAENLCNIDTDNAALHSLQLLPTFTRGLELNSDELCSPLVPCLDQDISLCGVCLLVSGPKEGYIYDVFNTPRLLSVYKYTRDTLKVSVCHTLLHAITKQGLETYTVRMFAAASESVRQKETLRLQNKISEANTKMGDVESDGENATMNDNEVGTEKDSKEDIIEKKILFDGEGVSQTEVPSASASTFYVENERTCDVASTSSREGSLTKSVDSKKSINMVSFTGLGPLEQDHVGEFTDDQLSNYLEENLKGLPMKKLPQNSVEKIPRTSTSKPVLPIIELSYLKNVCPPSTLDICLIGMYPFVGPSYVMCSEESVVLFTRASRALNTTKRSPNMAGKSHQAAGDKAQPEWSIYLLQNMDPVQLYKAVMPLASRCQKPNPQAYHHLISEQHMFLRSCCLPDNENVKAQKKIKKLMCESAANLGDLYSKCNKEQLTSCAEYYDMSGLPFHDVVSRAWKLGSFGEGLANYLDQKLLGSDEPVFVSEGIAKKIFKIYTSVNPSRVSEVILMSSLTGFSSETSIAALEDLNKAKTAEGKIYRFSALDNLVSAILYLNQCEPDHAQAALSSIQEAELIETVVSRCFMLHDNYEQLTPLAQMLRKHKPAIFLEILLRLHDTKKWSLETILNLLGANKQDVQHNYQVTEFLEAILNDKRRLDSFPSAVDCLSNILLLRLVNYSTQKGVPMQSLHQHIPKGDGYFAPRYDWLNKLAPYSGSSCPDPDQSCCRNTSGQPSPRTPRHLVRPVSSTQLSRKTPPYTSSTPGTKVSPGSGRMDGGCSCCCCTENLLKLQALLSSNFTSSVLCESLLSKIEDKEFKGDLSILLLCYPRLEKFKDAAALILERCPTVMIAFGELFFKSDIHKWSHLLNVLLQKFKLSRPNDEVEFQQSREAMLAVLKGTLSKLAQLTSPQEFLSLIPDEAALGFFLPYLEQCVRQRSSDALCVKLSSDNIENSIHSS